MAKARMKVMTPVFRVSFPSVFSTAKLMKDADAGTVPKYEVTMVFEPKKFTPEDKAKIAAMKAILDEASMEKFKRTVDKLPANFNKAFRDGAEKEHLAGFGPGTVFAKASSRIKPGVVSSDGKTAIVDDPAAFYPGCYARATVTAYAYDNRSKGVAFGLSNLQFVRDGERLDSQTDAAADFGESAEPSESDDLI